MMKLRDIRMDDLPMYVRSLTDPGMMAELGGPIPRDGLEDKLRGVVRSVEEGAVWFRVIVPDAEPDAGAGSVCIWDHDQDGDPITEIGWMVLPEFQGRGLATEAVRAILKAARADGRWRVIHAFPGVTNGPSNAICEKAGFSLMGERDIGGRAVEYAGRVLRCNHWAIDLRLPE